MQRISLEHFVHTFISIFESCSTRAPMPFIIHARLPMIALILQQIEIAKSPVIYIFFY